MNSPTANLVLVDTSVWIQYFNLPNSSEHAEVHDLILQNLVATTGVVVAEVLQGARSREHFTELVDLMEGIHYLETTREVWSHVAEMAFALRSDGTVMPLPDLIVSAVALEYKCALFTRDRAFQRIPGLQLYEPPA